jgi:hypothetical protein
LEYPDAKRLEIQERLCPLIMKYKPVTGAEIMTLGILSFFSLLSSSIKEISPLLLLLLFIFWFVLVSSAFIHADNNAQPYLTKQALTVWRDNESHKIFEHPGMKFFDNSTRDTAFAKAKTGILITE